MAEIVEAPGLRLIETRLKLAQEALAADNLNEAQDFFKKALEVEGNYPERAPKIRQHLKSYSDQLAARTPPNWDLAHHALELLASLKLEDSETRTWQRELWLKQADFLLGEKDLNHSFKIFSELLAGSQRTSNQDELKGEISRIVRENISQQAKQGDLLLLDQIIAGVRELQLAGDELHAWLETISKALSAAGNAARAREQQLKQEFEDQLKELRRKQNIIYALIGIFVLAAIVYIIFILAPWLSS
jgi:hypothetical protein